MTERLRLLIADRAATRAGIRMALNGSVEVCAEADNAEQAIRAAKREQPDLCLISDHIAGDGLAAIRGVTRAAPGCAVVVLAQAHDADYLLECVRAGAVGYVPGALDAERLNRVVNAAANNEAVVPRSMVLELVLELRGGGNGADALTARESQVLGMLRRGHRTRGHRRAPGDRPGDRAPPHLGACPQARRRESRRLDGSRRGARGPRGRCLACRVT